jgi:hypothetical protein
VIGFRSMFIQVGGMPARRADRNRFKSPRYLDFGSLDLVSIASAVVRNFVEIGCHKPRLSISSARSTRRLEKPHSLSYHARILTNLPPMTKVESASIMDERGSPR